MTARACLLRKIAAGKVDAKRATATIELWDQLAAQNGVQPSHITTGEVTAALRRRLKQSKRRKLMQIRAAAETKARADDHPDRVPAAMMSKLAIDASDRIVAPSSVETTTDIVRKRAFAIATDFIDTFRSKAAGLTRRKTGLRDIVRERFGENSGNAEAATLGQGVGEMFEYLRRTFNQYGGDIPQRKNWGLPQTHDRGKMAAVTADEWIDFTLPELNRAEMIDLATGLPMTDRKLRSVLVDVYGTATTDGRIDLKPGGGVGRGIISRRQESRFLVFRDADSWLRYQQRFGAGDDLFTMIVGQVDAMARDIALIKELGPNPEATLRYMSGLIDQSAAREAIEGTGKAAQRAAARITGGGNRGLQDTYNVVSGASLIPGNQKWANIFATNRSILISSILGSAALTSVSDINFGMLTRQFNGLPIRGMIQQQLKFMNPRRAADRRMAARAGFIADSWTSSAIGAQRYLGEAIGREWSGRVADTVLRVSLLTPWTDSGRLAFQMEFLGFLTEHRKTPLAGLNAAFRKSFGRYGVTEADWDLYRKTPLWTDPETGATFIRPDDVPGNVPQAGALFDRAHRVADKVMTMILAETARAVPTTTARVTALLTGGTRPGTLWGEITRNTVLLKGFPVTVAHTHLQRAAAAQGGVRPARYVALLIIGTMAFGVLSNGMQDIKNGKDPAPIDPRTEEGRLGLVNGLLRGGGLGIFGDFLFNDVNRFGQGLAKTLAGPVVQEVDKFGRLTLGNVRELALEGEAKNVGREAVRFIKGIAPGQSIWYSKLAMERLIFDQMQLMIDPGAAKSFNDAVRREQRDVGRTYFWRPGQTAPDRLPEVL